MTFRVLLIYPPAYQTEPGRGSPGRHDPDRLFMPYGMLTMTAELRARGFEADAINLSTFPFEQALAAIRDRPADLFGLSCYTFHRHATAALGTEIKRLFPESHLTIGGPHVSALAREWLDHYPAFDTVVIGEGEATVVELAERLRDRQPTDDVPGTAYRRSDADHAPRLAPARPLVADLDALARPWEHFDYGFLITSRGCPGRCTFCCSPKLWGPKIRFRSAENVLEELEELVARRGHRFLNVKDDTFTANKKRALAICRGIAERGLVFRWVCDTRVDLVDPETLAAMRRAGCVRLNLGVESGNPEILRNLNKRIELDQVRKVTADARDLGLDVRFYLIVGSRGETPETVYQTLEFVDQTGPTSCLFHGLSIYPGTEEFEIARQQGLLSAEEYFDPGALGSDFFPMGEKSERMTHVLRVVGSRLFGIDQVQEPFTTADREQILARHPDMLLSYTELAICYAREWRLDEAERLLDRAADRLGGETPEILHYRACVRFAGRDFPGAQAYFGRALEAAPNDTSLIHSWNTLQAAGPMSYQKQGRVAQQLLADLRSTEFLYLPDGTRQLTMPPASAGE
ncbi:MAG TPA: radical SAM protein [Thermoguttaceae bacterium]|nr:radical SAM protein [Thermoguttaceae bacterium]